jgi:hypothetical protein
MTSANKRFTQKTIAVVVIVTLLYGAGVAPIAMLFVSGVIFLVMSISRRVQTREVERIFDFYLAAEAILREEERRWYGFEVAEVIENGELVLETIPDPPPLHLFTLGALYNSIGNAAAAARYLTGVVDDEYSDERHQDRPSPQLRRYVNLLRRIESEPSLAPQTLGAIRSLERMRRRQAAPMLAANRRALNTEAEGAVDETKKSAAVVVDTPIQVNTGSRPPIHELLHDIYSDEEPAN